VLLFILYSVPMFVIPAQAGIHVSQGFKWTPAFAGVTDSSRNYYSEIGSINSALIVYDYVFLLSLFSVLQRKAGMR